MKLKIFRRVLMLSAFVISLYFYSFAISLSTIQDMLTRQLYASARRTNIHNEAAVDHVAPTLYAYNKSNVQLQLRNNSTNPQQVNSLTTVTNNLRTPITNDVLIDIDICRTVSPYLIVMVPSAPGHTKQRQAIRDTYARLSRDRVKNVYGWKVMHIVRVLFVLGIGDEHTEERVKGESIAHNDILQFGFIDSYYNLTRKILHGFKWISTHCENVTYVLKADDDVFVNTIALLVQLKKHPIPDTGAVYGFIYHGARLWRFGKWAISADIHPEKILPEYVSGTAYTLTANLLPKIVHEAELLPYIQTEDTYITGILASVRLGASLVHLPGSSHLSEHRTDACSFVELGRIAKLISIRMTYMLFGKH